LADGNTVYAAVKGFTADDRGVRIDKREMPKNYMLKSLVGLMIVIEMCGLASCAEQSAGDANYVSSVLDGLKQKTTRLQSYQCEVNYLFSQPVLESKTLRTGKLYYARLGNGSKLRINFDTLTQDENPQQKYGEQYIFDGQWLTHIDYQIKQVQKRQLAEANEQIDAFELAKRNFPLIGFDKSEDLKKEFDVNLAGEANGVIDLQLKVKPDSIYKDDYKSVEVWIDKGLVLPAKISAVSTEGDIYEISFVKPKANEVIDEKVFEFTIPGGFGKPEIIPLKKK
jgi:outer membrane lipoprotein-sorting protein